MQEDSLLKQMRSGCCLFDSAKPCTHCFSCIGLINQKTPPELNAFEAAKLLDYKLYQLNLDDFSRRVNANYRKNGGQHEIIYSMNRDIEQMLSVTAEIADDKQKTFILLNIWAKACAASICSPCLKPMQKMTHQHPVLLW